ncbi:carbamoyl-phosphate synthase large subunit [Desulfobaculum xiamenense]|uniref:Carbamoyl-phosphate synthase large subunit n=1 Tax=Desulfobaculum xiamenense TaxID=995050 RepID=A0A846QVC9_9BACT|nr:hypothetical protein [Desulfobaculum xiamenense]NJB69515.1 carbamoyl-phosphate synthase large subunit [Desulfobaculum xiamenense]
MPPTVLVTSAGSGVGCAVVRALRIATRHFRIIGLNSVALNPGAFQCDAAYLAPPTASGSFGPRLIKITNRERPDLIIAGRDEDVPVLAELRPQLEAFGSTVPVPSVEAAGDCLDKARTSRVLPQGPGGFARTACTPEDALALMAECGPPLIVKPTCGNASRGVRILYTPEDITRAFADDADIVAQEYLWPEERGRRPGCITPRHVMNGHGPRQDNEYSVQVLIGRDGGVLGMFASRNALCAGVPVTIETIRNDALERAACNVAQALAVRGLRGPLNMQAIRTGPDVFTFFELNARFTGITATRAAMGFREVEALYGHFVDGDDIAELLHFQDGIISCRLMTDTIFTRDDLERLNREQQWPRSS